MLAELQEQLRQRTQTPVTMPCRQPAQQLVPDRRIDLIEAVTDRVAERRQQQPGLGPKRHGPIDIEKEVHADRVQQVRSQRHGQRRMTGQIDRLGVELPIELHDLPRHRHSGLSKRGGRPRRTPTASCIPARVIGNIGT